MRHFTIITTILLIISCESGIDEDFKAIYQREICNKYSLYAKTKNLEGHLSLYADDAIVNNNLVPPIQGIKKSKRVLLNGMIVLRK